MFKIGEFALLSSISIHMLRHYDKLGLLVPAHIDEATGYRYYSEEQIPVANRICALKDMGIPLKDIAALLLRSAGAKQLHMFLDEKILQKEAEIAALQNQLQRMKSAAGELYGNQDTAYIGAIAVKTMPARIVASYRSTVKTFQQEGDLWRHLNEVCHTLGVRVASPAYSLAVQHGIDEENGCIDVEVQCAVERLYDDTQTVKFLSLPECRFASLASVGAYEKIRPANRFIAKWLVQNGYEMAGPVFSLYHISPQNEVKRRNLSLRCVFRLKIVSKVLTLALCKGVRSYQRKKERTK